MVPADYVRKQTLVNAERYINPELKKYEDTVLNAGERARTGIRPLRPSAAHRRRDRPPPADGPPAGRARRACLAGRGRRTVQLLPARWTTEERIDIRDGRHPVIERMPLPREFVPNDTCLDPRARTALIITGPNMAGKSTYIRQVALIVLMAQMGSFVPAAAAQHRRRGPHLHPRRRIRRSGPRPEHVHGRDERDGQHPQQRHADAA